MKNNTILENGEQLDLLTYQIEALEKDGFIYHCSECGFYHVDVAYNMQDVLNRLELGFSL